MEIKEILRKDASFRDYEQRMLEPVLSLEEFKAKQNEIFRKYGGRLPEVCEEMNSLNLSFIKTHNGWTGGKINGGILEHYDGRQVYNFVYDFMIPNDVPILHKYIHDWAHGDLESLEKICGLVEENGLVFYWS